jgi:hypothetical protein
VVRKPKGKSNLEDVGVDGGNVKVGCEEMEWHHVYRIHSALDRKQWRSVVNTVMNLLIP